MATLQIRFVPVTDLDRELDRLDNSQLRQIKLANSEAHVGTHSHTVMRTADRILRSREGIYLGTCYNSAVCGG